MLRGFLIIMIFLFGGDALRLAGVPLPGNVIGMVLLAAALRLRVVRREWVAPAATFLIDNLSLLFVPAGVGVMALFGVIERSWLPLSVSVLGSTLVVLAATGLLEERLGRLFARIRRRQRP